MAEPDERLPGLTMADIGAIAEARATIADIVDRDDADIRAACEVLIAKSPDPIERKNAAELLEIMTW